MKHKKQKLLAALLFLGMGSLFAQQDPVNAGGNATGSNGSVSYSVSDIDTVDLLKDPEFLLQSLKVKKQALKSTIAQLANLTNKASNNEDITKAKNQYNTCSAQYDDALKTLQSSYTDNTVLAVEMYLKRHPGKTDAATEVDLVEINTEAKKASEAKLEKDSSIAGAQKTDKTPITTDDVAKIVAMIKNVNDAQTALEGIGKRLAELSRSIVSKDASVMADILFFTAKFQLLLDDIKEEEDKLALSISNSNKKQKLK